MRAHAATLTLIALALTCLAPLARAQSDTTITASLGAETAAIGEGVTLTISVEGGAGAEPPEFPPIEGAEIVYRGESSRSSFVQGLSGRPRISQTTSFNYQVTPMRAGRLVIPSVTVVVDGEPLRTSALELSVTRPRDSDAAPVTLEVSERRPFVGEPFVVRFRWVYPNRLVKNGQITGEALSERVRILGTIDPRPPGTPARNQRFTEARLFGADAVGTVESFRRGTEIYTAVTIEMHAVAREPGAHAIGPVELAFDEVTGVVRDWPFDQERTERRIARSSSITINARPLPEGDAPPGFAGVVGRVALTAGVDTDRVGVGDPITLRLEIRADEPLGRIEPPDLADDPAFSGRFRVDSEGWSPAGTRLGVRAYETVIRAVDGEVDTVPPIRIPYFDTDAGAYRVAATEPIPLEVAARRRVTAADAEIARDPTRSDETVAARARTALERAEGGAPAPVVSDAVLRERAFTLTQALSSPGAIAVLAGGPACVLAAAGLALARDRRDPTLIRRRRALREAHRRSRRSPDGQAEGARTLLAAHARADAASITAEDARRLLGDDDDTRPVVHALERAEAERFGGRDAVPPVDARDLRRAMARAHARLMREETSR